MESNMKSGKGKVRITPEFISQMVKFDRDDIPEDATLLRLEYKADKDAFEAVFKSKKWPETPEGGKVKYVDKIHKIKNNE